MLCTSTTEMITLETPELVMMNLLKNANKRTRAKPVYSDPVLIKLDKKREIIQVSLYIIQLLLCSIQNLLYLEIQFLFITKTTVIGFIFPKVLINGNFPKIPKKKRVFALGNHGFSGI